MIYFPSYSIIYLNKMPIILSKSIKHLNLLNFLWSSDPNKI